ncbi:hypothetical protein XENTR_v10010828 [Xenopus tropicalis]|nr:hypothetical protein XENTR_v10010828 [Xenopus tropicalis]
MAPAGTVGDEGRCIGCIGRGWQGCPTAAMPWARWASLLLFVAVMAALQMPVRAMEDSTQQPDQSMAPTESPTWTSQGTKSSFTDSGVLDTIGKVLENSTLYNIFLLLSSKNTKNYITPASVVQENVSVLSGEYNSSVELSTVSTSQFSDQGDTNSGQNNTSILTYLFPFYSSTPTQSPFSSHSISPTVLKENPASSNLGDFPSSSFPSPLPLLSTSLSSSPRFTAGFSDDTMSTTTVPYTNRVTLGSTSKMTSPGSAATGSLLLMPNTSIFDVFRDLLSSEGTTTAQTPSSVASEGLLTRITTIRQGESNIQTELSSAAATLLQHTNATELPNTLSAENSTSQHFMVLESLFSTIKDQSIRPNDILTTTDVSLNTGDGILSVSTDSLSTSHLEYNQTQTSSLILTGSTVPTNELISKRTNVTDITEEALTSSKATTEMNMNRPYTDLSPSTLSFTADTHVLSPTDHAPTVINSSDESAHMESPSTTVFGSNALTTINKNNNPDSSNPVSDSPASTGAQETNSLHSQQTDKESMSTSNNIELSTVFPTLSDSAPSTKEDRSEQSASTISSFTPGIGQVFTSPNRNSISYLYLTTLEVIPTFKTVWSSAANPYTSLPEEQSSTSISSQTEQPRTSDLLSSTGSTSQFVSGITGGLEVSSKDVLDTSPPALYSFSSLSSQQSDASQISMTTGTSLPYTTPTMLPTFDTKTDKEQTSQIPDTSIYSSTIIPYMSEGITLSSSTHNDQTTTLNPQQSENTTPHSGDLNTPSNSGTDSSTSKVTFSESMSLSEVTTQHSTNTSPQATASSTIIDIKTDMSDITQSVVSKASTLLDSDTTTITPYSSGDSTVLQSTVEEPLHTFSNTPFNHTTSSGTVQSDLSGVTTQLQSANASGTPLWDVSTEVVSSTHSPYTDIETRGTMVYPTTKILETSNFTAQSSTSIADMESGSVTTITSEISNQSYVPSSITSNPLSTLTSDLENVTVSVSSTAYVASEFTGSKAFISALTGQFTDHPSPSTPTSQKTSETNSTSPMSTYNLSTENSSTTSSFFQTVAHETEVPSKQPTPTEMSSALTSLGTFTTQEHFKSTAAEYSKSSTVISTHVSTSPAITSEMSLSTGSSTKGEASVTFPTTNHLSSNSISSTHSSAIPYTVYPTNISNSVFTVLSTVPTGESSAVSLTEHVTRKSSSTSTVSTSQMSSVHETPKVSTTNMFNSTTLQSTEGSAPTTTTPTTTVLPEKSSTAQKSTLTPTSVFLPTKISDTTITPLIATTHTSTTVRTASPASNATSVSVTKPAAVPTIKSELTSATITTQSVTPSPSLISTFEPSTVPTTPLALECKLSPQSMLKTVLTLPQWVPDQDMESVVENMKVVLMDTLYQALKLPIQVLVNQSSIMIATDQKFKNVTVGYFVLVNVSVYIPSTITDIIAASSSYVANLMLQIPNLLSVPVPAAPWDPVPDYIYRLKTVLKLMTTAGSIYTCSYVQGMEQRLQVAYDKAEVLTTYRSSNLTVQILSTSQTGQFLTLIYVVKNGSFFLNGTTSSSLLNALSGEVVGYYLGDPPSIIAEPLYYPSIDISDSTRDYWVNTVIVGVASDFLGINNQSFARLMEGRLAQLFQNSGQQSRRFKRATTVGSYTVQMVQMQRVDGSNNPAELTYYAEYNKIPILGTVAAKQLSTIDPQTMALTLGYIVRVQADPVVKNPPNNLWIIAAVLAPIAVVTVIIIIITAVLCRKNKSDFKSDNMSNVPPRTKPVQGFDYAKQHLGQQGGDEEALPVTQETVVPSLNLSQERDSTQDGSTEKMLKSENRKSRSPCENGSVISNESEEASSDRSTPQKALPQLRLTKEEACKRNGLTKQKRKIVPVSDEEEGNMHFDKNTKMMVDPFDSSSGSVQLISIKPMTVPPSHLVSERNQELAAINGEVNKALKQKSDIEHYRNKLRLKAKRKGYYDFPPILDSRSLTERKKKIYEKTQLEIDNVLDADTDTSSPFAEPKNRQPSIKNHPYRSRQSLNSPSPGETEMDLLVTRERPRRGIRNSGYDTEPEMIEETNIDRVKQARTFIKSRQGKGHSETSTLSSQPSIDEVRQQMHMLLEEAFSLASAGHGAPKRQQDPYASAQHLPYSEVVTSAPGTMSRPRVQWVPTYGPEMYQYSLPRPTYRFSQLPEMVMGSPPPPIPPRTGPVAVTSLQRSAADTANKSSRVAEPSGSEQGPGEHGGFPPVSRAPVTVAQADQSVSNYTGKTTSPRIGIKSTNRNRATVTREMIMNIHGSFYRVSCFGLY